MLVEATQMCHSTSRDPSTKLWIRLVRYVGNQKEWEKFEVRHIAVAGIANGGQSGHFRWREAYRSRAEAHRKWTAIETFSAVYSVRTVARATAWLRGTVSAVDIKVALDLIDVASQYMNLLEIGFLLSRVLQNLEM